jgi:hypothetical protein
MITCICKIFLVIVYLQSVYLMYFIFVYSNEAIDNFYVYSTSSLTTEHPNEFLIIDKIKNECRSSCNFKMHIIT